MEVHKYYSEVGCDCLGSGISWIPFCTPLIGRQDILSKSLFAVYINLNLNNSRIAVFIKANLKDNSCPTQTLTELK